MKTKTISAAEFCRMSGLCLTTTRKLIKSEKLQSTKVGNRRLIWLDSAEALLSPDYSTAPIVQGGA